MRAHSHMRQDCIKLVTYVTSSLLSCMIQVACSFPSARSVASTAINEEGSSSIELLSNLSILSKIKTKHIVGTIMRRGYWSLTASCLIVNQNIRIPLHVKQHWILQSAL